jgi:hypothetical protein
MFTERQLTIKSDEGGRFGDEMGQAMLYSGGEFDMCYSGSKNRQAGIRKRLLSIFFGDQPVNHGGGAYN